MDGMDATETPPPVVRKKPRPLNNKALEEIRLHYCAGILPLQTVAENAQMHIKRLKNLAKKHKWERGLGAHGIPDQTAKGLKVGPNEIFYMGPLTPEERKKVDEFTAGMVGDVLKTHERVVGKTIRLAEQYLDEVIAGGGKIQIEKVVKDPQTKKFKVVKLEVSGLPVVDAVALILSRAVPLDRQTAGLEPYQGATGESDMERRRKDRLAVIGEEVAKRMADRLDAMAASSLSNGHAHPATKAISSKPTVRSRS